ncbi:GNAT family N-acetyltransferase [Amycolatopsis pigmentata]|uniref:GNAT family N-acetyltransferase n=1 Tax=Amycolatopsis pigmentata TaxID=450801 RepID=A0ABW5FXH3_9PSEU
MLADHFPLFGLRLTTPRLELRLPSDVELAALAELAAQGVHDPEKMPFFVPWTDGPPSGVARGVIQHHWLRLGEWEPRGWELKLAVFHEGAVVGQQAIGARDFAVTREVSTGSWLGLRYHGQGIGTEMRAAVLHLAFAGLAAQDAVSGAWQDNHASLAVSRKLGYRPDGVARRTVRGALAIEQRLRLPRSDWENGHRPPVTIDGLPPCLPLFGVSAS